jgi:predicted metalloprotease
VIAHEVGHHVQNLLGLGQIRGGRQDNNVSVRRELQADCLAGVWAHHEEQARKILERGDLEEAIRAAAAIGDDRLQRQSQGTVVPDSFTHGTSAQRVRWLRTGLEGGDVARCDTFRTREI